MEDWDRIVAKEERMSAQADERTVYSDETKQQLHSNLCSWIG